MRRASSDWDIFCFFMARCSSEASSRLIASAVASSAGPSFFSSSSVSRSARREGFFRAILLRPLPRQGAAIVQNKSGATLAHRMLRCVFRMIPATDIVHLIQSAVAPVFLLSGVGVTLGVLTNRLARIVDRARLLEMREDQEQARADST